MGPRGHLQTTFAALDGEPYGRGGSGILGILAALGRSGHEVAWPFATAERKALDRDFIRNMTAHHQVGVRLSLLAAEKAIDDEVRMLGRLMAANRKRRSKSWPSGGAVGTAAKSHR